MDQILFGPEVPLGRLNRCVPQKHLDLLKLAAGRPTKLRAGSPQIVWRDAGDTHFGRVLPEHLPDDLLAQTFAGKGARAVHGPEHVASGNAGRRSPCVDRHFHPGRHRRRPNAAVLSDKIDDTPAAVALLNVRERERRHFRSPEAAAEKNGKNRAIPQPANR